MNTLLLCPPLFPPQPGGSQRLFADLADLWVSHGGRAVVYTTTDRPDSPEVNHGTTVRRFRCRAMAPDRWWGRFLAAASHAGGVDWQAALGFPHRSASAYRRFLRRQALATDGPFDIMVGGVLPHNYFLAPASRLARRNRIPLVAVPLLHAGLLARHPLRHVAGPAAAELLRRATAVVAMTPAEHPLLQNMGVSEEKIHTIPAALAHASLPPAPWPAGVFTGDPRPYALQAGALAADKGTLQLVDAHARRVQAGAPESLVLAGTPRPEVQRHLRTLPGVVRQTVHLVQQPPDAIWNGIMQHAACLVQPSLADSFGLVVLEGWRAGLPVIAARAGGLPFLIRDGEDGLVVAPDRPQQLAAALDTLFRQPQQATALGMAGRSRLARAYTWERVYPRWQQLFQQVMTADAGAPPA